MQEIGAYIERIYGSDYGFHDAQIIRLENAMFGTVLSDHMHEWIGSRIFGEYLHFCYMSYFGIIFGSITVVCP